MQSSFFTRALTAAMLASSSLCLPITTTASIHEGSLLNFRRQENPNSVTMGPVEVPPGGIRSASASLVTFADEVVDISNISIFGDVNDGNVNCTTAEAGPGDNALNRPVLTGEMDAGSSSIVTFGDEVVDISGISVFGDVNDVGCESD